MNIKNLLMLAGMLLVAGCTSQTQVNQTTDTMTSGTTAVETTGAMDDTDTTTKTFNISASNNGYSLSEIRVKKGDTVNINLTVKEGVHNITVDGFNAKTKDTDAGQTSSVTFVADKTGTFPFYCNIANHRARGLEGKIIVE